MAVNFTYKTSTGTDKFEYFKHSYDFEWKLTYVKSADLSNKDDRII